jgi:hypothetical protein
MRLHHHLALVAALSLSVPVALSAQTTSSTSGTDQTSTTTTVNQTGSGTTTTQTQTTTTTTPSNTSSTNHPNRWTAAAFVGSNFSNNSASTFGGVNSPTAISTSTSTTGTVSSSGSSVDYGGEIGYLWHSIAGAEFLAGFTPNFHLENTLIETGTTPNVNTYMVNAIGVVPIGGDANVQPFISGGFGAITMRGLTAMSTMVGTTTTTTGGSAVSAVFDPNESHAGGDIGGGIMAFMGGWGVRGDIRYFRAFGNTTSSNTTTATTGNTTTTASTINLLPGLNFWRANIGLAFRW